MRIGENGGLGMGGLNMTKWYDLYTFDILGEMAFNKSFHCIKAGVLGSLPLFSSNFLSFDFFSSSWLAAKMQLP